MLHLRRRDFIAMLGSTVAWSTMAHPAERGPRIGVLTLLSRHDEGGRVADFVAGLRGLGITRDTISTLSTVLPMAIPHGSIRSHAN
jgi:hypothetical protein